MSNDLLRLRSVSSNAQFIAYSFLESIAARSSDEVRSYNLLVGLEECLDRLHQSVDAADFALPDLKQHLPETLTKFEFNQNTPTNFGVSGKVIFANLIGALFQSLDSAFQLEPLHLNGGVPDILKRTQRTLGAIIHRIVHLPLFLEQDSRLLDGIYELVAKTFGDKFATKAKALLETCHQQWDAEAIRRIKALGQGVTSDGVIKRHWTGRVA